MTTPPTPPPPPRQNKWRKLYEAMQRGMRSRSATGGGPGIGRGSGNIEISAFKLWLTESNESYLKQWRGLNRYSLENFASDMGNLSNSENPLESVHRMGTSAGGTLGSALANRMAQDRYQYSTVPAIGLLGNYSGATGSLVSSYLGSKTSILKEYQDQFGQAGSLLGTLSGGALSSVAKLIPAASAPTALVKGGTFLLSLFASGYLANKGDTIGRDVATKYMSGYAQNLADKTMAGQLNDPQRILNYYTSAIKAYGIYNMYKGDNLLDISKDFMDNNMYFFNQDIQGMSALVGSLNASMPVGEAGIKQLSQKITKLSGSTGYDTGTFSNIYGNVMRAYGTSSSKNNDIEAVSQGVEKLFVAAMGAQEFTPMGINMALGLSALSDSLVRSKGGLNKGSTVVDNIAGIQNFVRTNVGSKRSDTHITESAVAGINSILEDGATSRSTGRTRFVSKLKIGVGQALGGVEGDRSILPKVLQQIITDLGLKSGDLGVKDGVMTGDTRSMGRLRMYLKGKGPMELGLEGDSAESIALMTAAFLQNGDAGLDDVKSQLPEFKKEEVIRNRMQFLTDVGKLSAAHKRTSDELLPLIEKFVPSFLEVNKLTITFFKKNGMVLAKEFANSMNLLFGDLKNGAYMTYDGKSSGAGTLAGVGNGFDDIVTAVYDFTGSILPTSGSVKQDSDGFKKYSSKFQPGFIAGVEKVAKNLQIDPNWLLAAMSYETGGTFDPSIKNSYGYAGLLQFNTNFQASMQKKYGVDITKVSQVDQLKYVQEFLSPLKGKMKNASDVYLAVAAPAYVGKSMSDDFVIYKGAAAANNTKWNTNGDGVVTWGELKTALDRDPLSRGFLYSSSGVAYAPDYDNPVRQSGINLNGLGYSTSTNFAEALKLARSSAVSNAAGLQLSIFGNKSRWLTSNLLDNEALRNGLPHEGIDFHASMGTPVIAMADGVVNFTKSDLAGYGIGMSVRYKIGGVYIDAFYAHLSSVSKPAGAKVSKGERIAFTGNSGGVAAHLHFQAVVVDDKAGVNFRTLSGLWKYFEKIKTDATFVNAASTAFSLIANPNVHTIAQDYGVSFSNILGELRKKFPAVLFDIDKENNVYILNAYNIGSGKGVANKTKDSISKYIKEKNNKIAFSLTNKDIHVQVHSPTVQPALITNRIRGVLKK